MKSGGRMLNAKKRGWGLILFTALGIIVWTNFNPPVICGTGQTILLQAIFNLTLFSMLSFSSTRFFQTGILKKKNPYRTALIATLVFGLIIMFTACILITQSWHWESLLLITMGAFFGSFIASNLDKGWWENNAPPNSRIESEVLAFHKIYMGPIVDTSLQKRTLDIFFAAVSLIISMPVWLVIILMIWFEDPGPVLFVKNAVGRGGVNFKQLKFRSMITNAEKETGPISGYENDERVLFFGKFLRKTALDEIPQLINILLGEMSYVGPRPQRTVLVHGYLQRLPDYVRRHRVRPGLAGLAQVADTYDITPEEKLAWDLIYIERADIWLDIKLALSAFYLVFALRWMPNTHPELQIRKLLNIQKPKT